MTGQSDWLPMMMATGGVEAFMIDFKHAIGQRERIIAVALQLAHAFLA
jgi:hypothetical protein